MSCLGKPSLQEAIPIVLSMPLPNNIQLLECRKEHRNIIKAFRYMQSLSTKRVRYNRNPIIRIVISLVTGLIFSLHFKKLLWPKVAFGTGFDPTFHKRIGNFHIGEFQSYLYAKYFKEFYLGNPRQIERRSNYHAKRIIVHIRRGDYLNEFNLGFGVLSSNYFAKGLKLAGIETVKAKIFSDDNHAATKVLSSTGLTNYEIQKSKKMVPAEVLKSMTSGDTYLLSNSTFGWWGAYLADNNSPTVFIPNPWHKNLEQPNEMSPKDWIRIEAWENGD